MKIIIFWSICIKYLDENNNIFGLDTSELRFRGVQNSSSSWKLDLELSSLNHTHMQGGLDLELSSLNHIHMQGGLDLELSSLNHTHMQGGLDLELSSLNHTHMQGGGRARNSSSAVC